MKLAVSNLAWNNDNSDIILRKISKIGISHIECSLTKIDNWSNITEHKLNEFMLLNLSNNIKIYSLQSLFYGIDCAITDDNFIIEHFEKLINFSKCLNFEILVFGSPNLRKKIDGWEISLKNIFSNIDKYITNFNKNIKVVIEPNSKIYGAEFFTNISEIISFIEENNLKNIYTMIDTHNLLCEKEDPIKILKNHFDYIKHIHISEPNLMDIIENKFHHDFSYALMENNYKHTITYESKSLSKINTFIKIYSSK